MAGSMNKVMILGNVARDPEVRHSNDGGKIVTLSVATSEQWKDRNTGERKERSEFHRVVIFNERLADITEKYLKKGSKAYFEGQLQTRKWTDQSGQDRYVTEVVLPKFRGEILLLGGRSDSGFSTNTSSETHSFDKAVGSNVTSHAKISEPVGSPKAGPKDDLSDFDDDIPF